MSHTAALALAALAASVLLLIQLRGGPYAIFAVVVSAIEALLAFGIVSLHVTHVPLALILGGALALLGIILYLKVSTKHAVAAATVVTLVGAVQLLTALRFL